MLGARAERPNKIELHRIADDNRPFCSGQQRESRGNIALARFVKDDVVKKTGREGNARGHGKGADCPDRTMTQHHLRILQGHATDALYIVEFELLRSCGNLYTLFMRWLRQ